MIYFLKWLSAQYFCQSGSLKNIVQDGRTCRNVGFPTIPLGILRGEREKNKEKERNCENSCTFLFLTPSTLIFWSEIYSFIGKTKYLA
jgi:hypothetical protein